MKIAPALQVLTKILYCSVYITMNTSVYVFPILEFHIAIGGNFRLMSLFTRYITKFRNDNNTKLVG
jgi:hypothetical protein